LKKISKNEKTVSVKKQNYLNPHKNLTTSSLKTNPFFAQNRIVIYILRPFFFFYFFKTFQSFAFLNIR